ncbi:MAG: TetR/AcrR family transcriptional regulator [Bacteroidales bacterium]|nr:TetR/AcrR family transcriptional regulator [Bacteroidales bacterium]
MENGIKERIIEETCSLFTRYGIRAVTMDTIASQMGISKRTIYENFCDKDDLVLSVMTWMGTENMKTIKKLEEESETVIHLSFKVIEMVGSMMERFNPLIFEDLRKYHHLVEKNTERLRIQDNIALSRPFVTRGIREGFFRPDINPDLINRALHAVFQLTGDFNHFPRELFRRDEVVRSVYLNYLRGISTRAGIELIDKIETETYKH